MTIINLNGFPFECACGECFRTISAAAGCRKCRNYCVFGYCTHVIDQRTGEVVHGTEPTEEEYNEALLEWEKARELERLEMEQWEADQRAEEIRFFEARAREAAELAEDQLWDIQERLEAC